MVLYEAQIKYKDRKTKAIGAKHLTIDPDSKNAQQDWDTVIRGLNKLFGRKCDPENTMSVFFIDGAPGCLEAVITHSATKASLEDCIDHIESVLSKNYAVREITVSDCKQISSKRLDYLGEKADDNNYIRRWHFERVKLGLDYFQNTHFRVEEYMEEKDYPTLEDALFAAKEIMADDTLIDELSRIYSDNNEKKYYGNPVHYKICTCGHAAAMDIVDLMVSALIANKRLCGRRILKIFNIGEGCFDESDFEHLFRSSEGNAVVIEMCGTNEDHGNFASSYQRVVDYIDEIIEKHHLNTLCFFVEYKEQTGFSRSLLSKVSENLRIIKINEGYGDRGAAANYLKKLAQNESFELSEAEIDLALSNKKMFSVAEVCHIFDNWFKDGLRKNIYRAYSDFTFYTETLKERSSAPYDDLQKMVGLSEIKLLVDEMIDAGKIRKLRAGMGLSAQKTSLHMVFTGNPGSAKTTVARLIAQILRKEDILDSGEFVECGRADLIAKYVGWTARNVRAKFREAKGGVLFIDEAYSLVDDSRSFADEAINTIVQEMENHRDDVIVIFAGYPGKMEEFLGKNEGLRSRIAFHLDFPDYTPDEMVKILLLMSEQRGYKIEKAAVEKCRLIFERACREEDFGNGRFVRNLLEQAELAQSHRIASRSRGRISKRTLVNLTTEDFDVNISRKVKEARIPIGFAV